MPIAFNRETERPFECCDLSKADVANFGETQAEIAKAKEPIWVVGIDLANQPGCAGVRSKEFSDGHMIDSII